MKRLKKINITSIIKQIKAEGVSMRRRFVLYIISAIAIVLSLILLLLNLFGVMNPTNARIMEVLDTQLLSYTDSIEDDYDKAMQERASTKGIIPFYDERGELQLSVTKENLLYVESADNYIYIWYMKGNLPKKLMLRNTLKRTAELLADTNVMRCHRGYMVNMEQVKVLRREKENFYLELGIEGVKDIPVSKTYGEAVLKWLSM